MVRNSGKFSFTCSLGYMKQMCCFIIEIVWLSRCVEVLKMSYVWQKLAVFFFRIFCRLPRVSTWKLMHFLCFYLDLRINSWRCPRETKYDIAMCLKYGLLLVLTSHFASCLFCEALNLNLRGNHITGVSKRSSEGNIWIKVFITTFPS